MFLIIGFRLTLANYGLFTVGTDRHDGYRCFKLLLQECDVVAELLGELAFVMELCHVGLPSGHGDIDGLDLIFLN